MLLYIQEFVTFLIPKTKLLLYFNFFRHKKSLPLDIQINSRFLFKSTYQLFYPLAEIGNRKSRQQDLANFHRDEV